MSRSLILPQAREIDSLESSLASLPRNSATATPRLHLLNNLIQTGSIDDEAALVAQYDWETWWARENQLAPQREFMVWLLLAGRGYGKTRSGVEWLNDKAREGIGPLAIVARTAADARDVLIEGPSGILSCSPPWFRPVYEPAKRRVTWPNGVRATVFSADSPDQLRGPQHAAALADELAAWKYAQEAWDNLIMGLRLGDNPQVAALTTPRPLKIIRDLLADPRTAITRGSTFENAANLSPDFIKQMRARYEGTRLGRQELYGELLLDLAGALWTIELLEACQAEPGVAFTPDMFERVAVGVDPSGSSGEDEGDAQGIVVAGKLKEAAAKAIGAREPGRHFAVVDDRTGRRRPEEWAKETNDAVEFWGADVIAVEKNYGGDMCRAVIQGHNPYAPVKLRSTSRGKHVRAEPVSMLYEQKRVTHARGLHYLEDEMRNFTGEGYQGGASPNRADAAIWALDELSGGSHAAPRVRAL